jgi:aldose 1-epimerase
MTIYKEPATASSDPGIEVWMLQHNNGGSARITNFGAVIMSWKVMKEDVVKDMVLGFDTVAEYKGAEYRKAYPYFGAIVGRYANRIKEGRFQLEGLHYQATPNLGNDALHGGKEGFDSKIWQVAETGENPEPFITLSYISPDGEEGFPGTLETRITYTLCENELRFSMEYHALETTIANMAQHTYFNLNGGSGNIAKHAVVLHASRYLGQDDTLNATGAVLPVTGTPLDFTRFKTVSAHWDETQGYDQSFVIDAADGQLRLCAECRPENGAFTLQVFTTEPIVHFYTGRWIPAVPGKEGHTYGAYSGLCFETQQHPNGINIPQFPHTILQAGEVYRRTDVYRVM